jgi:hypothetical protein
VHRLNYSVSYVWILTLKRWDSQFTNVNFQWSCTNNLKPVGWVSNDLQYKIYQKQSEFTTGDNTAQRPHQLCKKCNKHTIHAAFFTASVWNICCSNKHLARDMWFTSEIFLDKHVDIKWNAYYVLCLLLGDSLASEFYVPMFRNTPSVPSSQVGRYPSYLSTYEDGTDRVFRNVDINFRRRWITRKKAYNIQSTANVWNQERPNSFLQMQLYKKCTH